MGGLDAFWHVCNFFAPALVVGCVAAAAVKVVWRRTLTTVSWWLLAVCSAAVASLTLIAGLMLSGRDGSMLTYVAMVGASALTLWYVAFVKRR